MARRDPYLRYMPSAAVRLSLSLMGLVNPQLFNLSLDISETNNLALSQPDDVASLKQLYSEWESQMIEPLWQAPQYLVLTRWCWLGIGMHSIKRILPVLGA